MGEKFSRFAVLVIILGVVGSTNAQMVNGVNYIPTTIDSASDWFCGGGNDDWIYHPANLVNNNGLTPSTGEHGNTYRYGTTWRAVGVNKWIIFDLGAEYDLYSIMVWNYNLGDDFGEPNEGVATMDVYLADSSKVFAGSPDFDDFPLDMATGELTYTGKEYKMVANNVRYVKIVDFTLHNAGTWPSLSELRFRSGLLFATEPNPGDTVIDVPANPVLSWTPGLDAASQDVHLGTDYSEVNTSTSPVATGLSGDCGSYDPAGLFEFSETYYWRIDAINDTNTWKSIWSFTTGDYIDVDNFEGYEGAVGSGTNVFNTWSDGYALPHSSGSCVNINTATSSPIVVDPPSAYGGSKLMVYKYSNTGTHYMGYSAPCYSEIEADTADLGIDGDWAGVGFATLSLYFYGDSDNDVDSTERMYVALEDTSGNLAVKQYDGNANDLKTEAWQQWSITLQNFADINSVNLADVNTVFIGFGNRGEPNLTEGGTPGGSGVVYFDDIQLLLP